MAVNMQKANKIGRILILLLLVAIAVIVVSRHYSSRPGSFLGEPREYELNYMPADYEYQLLDATTGNVLVAYQASPSFTINNNGAFTVEMRQVGVVDGCIFRLENIGVLERNFPLYDLLIDNTLAFTNTDSDKMCADIDVIKFLARVHHLSLLLA